MIETNWIEIGKVSDIPLRGARRLCVGGQPIAIFRTGRNEIFALVDRCPHRGGPLSEGIVSEQSVTCPLHNWTIDLPTGKALAPDEGETQSLPLKLVGNKVLLHIEPLAGSRETGGTAIESTPA